MQYLPPLNFRFWLQYNWKEGPILLLLLHYLPPMPVPLSWDLSTLLLLINFIYRYNCKEGLIRLMLMKYLSSLHFSFCLNYNCKDILLLLLLLHYLHPLTVPISWDIPPLFLFLDFIYHLNCKEVLILLLLLWSLPVPSTLLSIGLCNNNRD